MPQIFRQTARKNLYYRMATKLTSVYVNEKQAFSTITNSKISEHFVQKLSWNEKIAYEKIRGIFFKVTLKNLDRFFQKMTLRTSKKPNFEGVDRC